MPGSTSAGNDNNGEQPAVGVRACGLNSELANRWLVWQCKMIADIISGSVHRTDGTCLAVWPANADGVDVLQRAADKAAQQRESVVQTERDFGAAGTRIGDVIACPVFAGGEPLAYVSILMTPRRQSRQHAVLQLVQWSGYWLESLSQLSNGVQQEASSFTQSLLNAILHEHDSQKIAMYAANQLAARLTCERVTLGFREGLVVRVKSISGLANFDPRTQLLRCIEAAMEECLDCGQMVCAPYVGDRAGVPDQAHRELSQQHGGHSNCTLPLRGRHGFFGAATLERRGTEGFDPDTIAWCESVLDVVSPVIELKRLEERPLWRKMLGSAQLTVRRYLGPQKLKLRIILFSLAAFLVVTSLISGTYEVKAPARVAGDVSQVIAAPLSGFIKSAEVRAGDEVVAGQLLANLDDRSLQLELKKWQGERNKTTKAYQEALAKRARTELSILRAKADQVDAEVALVQQQIERAQLRAPFDGYVVSGDLNQSLGAPVETGDVLFEIAPLRQYRVVLEVSERDMANVRVGQTGHIRIAAVPGDPLPFKVDQIVPLAVSDEGSSYFRVEANLTEELQTLRPGMEGIARIEMGDRKLLWIWTHNMASRLRMWFWSLGW